MASHGAPPQMGARNEHSNESAVRSNHQSVNDAQPVGPLPVVAPSQGSCDDAAEDISDDGQVAPHLVIAEDHKPSNQEQQMDNSPIVQNQQPLAIHPRPDQNHLAFNQPVNKNQPPVIVPANQAANLQASEHPFGHPPAWYVARLEMHKICNKCRVRRAHLPNARICLECLGDRINSRRRRMNEILHSGSFYCGTCYVRAAQETGLSCINCRDRRSATGIRRNLTFQLDGARAGFTTVLHAVARALAAHTFAETNRELGRAFSASQSSFRILQEANEYFTQLAAVDGPQADVVAPDLTRAYEQSTAVANQVSQAWDTVMARLVAPADADNAHRYPDANIPIGQLPLDN